MFLASHRPREISMVECELRNDYDVDLCVISPEHLGIIVVELGKVKMQ